MSAVISLDQVTLRHEQRAVIDAVSCDVFDGEFFVIIGPNGAGKTTLLRAIAGLHPLASGTLQLHGRPLAGRSRRELARTLAMVPQQLGDEFPFSVAETVLMGRFPHLGLLAVEGKQDLDLAREAMAFTETLHLADRRLGRLSGGERQRVIIARAICQQPRLLLLDEPTASLDPAHQLRILDLMQRLRREQGVTVVMVSHDLNLASAYADRLLLLNEGRVAALGSPAEVLTTESLERSYGCALHVDKHPILGSPRVSLLPGGEGAARQKNGVSSGGRRTPL
jgi:iron complex transport system ATP-binding protein